MFCGHQTGSGLLHNTPIQVSSLKRVNVFKTILEILGQLNQLLELSKNCKNICSIMKIDRAPTVQTLIGHCNLHSRIVIVSTGVNKVSRLIHSCKIVSFCSHKHFLFYIQSNLNGLNSLFDTGVE